MAFLPITTIPGVRPADAPTGVDKRLLAIRCRTDAIPPAALLARNFGNGGMARNPPMGVDCDASPHRGFRRPKGGLGKVSADVLHTATGGGPDDGLPRPSKSLQRGRARDQADRLEPQERTLCGAEHWAVIASLVETACSTASINNTISPTSSPVLSPAIPKASAKTCCTWAYIATQLEAVA